MKKSAQNRIIIWSIVSVVLIAILAAGFIVNANGRYVPSINDRIYGNSYDTDSDYVMKYDGLVYKEDEVLYLEINLINGKIIFKESDSDYIEINQINEASNDEADGFYYQYDDDRSLKIFGSDEDFSLEGQDYSSDSFLLGFGDIFETAPSKTIVVKIPKQNSYIPHITVNSASADIKIDNIDTSYLDINSFSGNIAANDFSAENISIENVSGDVKLQNATADDITVNNVSGKINIDGEIEYITLDSVSGDLSYSTDSLCTNSISINTVSGDTDITLPENSGFTVINSSVSGKIKSGFEGRQLDENYVYGDGSTEIELNSISGSVSINPQKDDKIEQIKSEQKQNKDKAAAATTATAETTSPTATTAPVTKKTND